MSTYLLLIAAGLAVLMALIWLADHYRAALAAERYVASFELGRLQVQQSPQPSVWDGLRAAELRIAAL